MIMGINERDSCRGSAAGIREDDIWTTIQTITHIEKNLMGGVDNE